jgi:hypothetical protein
MLETEHVVKVEALQALLLEVVLLVAGFVSGIEL